MKAARELDSKIRQKYNEKIKSLGVRYQEALKAKSRKEEERRKISLRCENQVLDLAKLREQISTLKKQLQLKDKQVELEKSKNESLEVKQRHF